MPTKRRKILPKRINQPVPQWAQDLLEGRMPPNDCDGFVDWYFFGDTVQGLPSALSNEGVDLVAEARKPSADEA
jgi:hypothetical protein